MKMGGETMDKELIVEDEKEDYTIRNGMIIEQ